MPGDAREPDRPHALPHPQPPPDPARDPFVGNETAAENLEETLEVVLWNTLGEQSHAVTIHVTDGGRVELRGRLDTEEQSRAAIEAIRATRGVTEVDDHLLAAAIYHLGGAAPVLEPLLYLRRFCAADEASTSAAIRQAVARLDAWFAETGHLPDRLLVVYRNLRPETVTLDIAMPLATPPQLPATSELRIGRMPLLVTAEIMADAGFPALLEARQRLLEQHPDIHGTSDLVLWQGFDDPSLFRPWAGHPAAPLYLSA